MPDFPATGGFTVADIWSAGTRTLTAFTGQPRTDLVGADNDIWSNATRSLTELTGQPRTDLLGEDNDFESATGARIANLDRMANILSQEPISEASTLMDGNELVLYEKTDALQRSVEGYIDFTNSAGGDTFVVREYMQIKAAGAYIKYAEATYTGVQSPALLHIQTKVAKRKIKVTIQQTAGVNRTLDNSWLAASQASAT